MCVDRGTIDSIRECAVLTGQQHMWMYPTSEWVFAALVDRCAIEGIYNTEWSSVARSDRHKLNTYRTIVCVCVCLRVNDELVLFEMICGYSI